MLLNFAHGQEPHARYTYAMRWFFSLCFLFLLLPQPAHACSPVIYFNDHDRLAAQIRSLKHAAAAFEGIVERGGIDVGSIALIRPIRIWFGPRLPRYVVQRVTMCDRSFGTGERVRVVLYDVEPEYISRWRFWDWVRFPGPRYRTAASADFEWSLGYKIMHDALNQRARHVGR